MSIVSYFFKISMALRSVHNRLVEDYGIPYWGSYILFAFATILLGAILGLVQILFNLIYLVSNQIYSLTNLQLIVCVIDLIFPAKLTNEDIREESKQTNPNADNSDLIDDTQEGTNDETNTNETNELRRRKKEKSSDSTEDKENE